MYGTIITDGIAEQPNIRNNLIYGTTECTSNMSLPEHLHPFKLLKYIFRFFYVVISNLVCIPSYMVWLCILYPVKLFAPNIFWTIEACLFKGLLVVVTGWTFSGGYLLYESGDKLNSIYKESAILLVNHQSTSDVPVVMATLQAKDLVIGRVMWVMDYIFKFTNFGWVSVVHGDFFILQGKESRDKSLGELKEHLEALYDSTYKKWMVLFPEGGFLRKRRQRSQEFAKKNDLPVLQHVTLPRVGALKVILDTLGVATNKGTNSQGRLKWIIDMTVGYPNAEALDLHGMCIGYWKPRKIQIHYRAYPISEIPTETEPLTKWMYQRFVEKEKMLEHFYKDGRNLEDSDNQERILPRVKGHDLPIDLLEMLIHHLFYITSCYVFWNYLFFSIFSVLGIF
ncbi:hypothetical protein FSP39_012890 [Pinctada imbricata]|uniref:Phospholipid/glycerol acyltransferase domain-containing protein n=1 Tax=Pinctada imbricata TaxID=66713 RepID=A0AA88XWI1_PINIB|nr:hypothetical protein FSP39_012890 [Pinctada imbricata]